MVSAKGLGAFVDDREVQLAAMQLYRALHYARCQAVARNRRVAVESVWSGKQPWHQLRIVVLQTKQTLRVLNINRRISILVRASGHSVRHIVFMPDGFTAGSQGSLTIHKGRYSRRVVWIRSGRVRYG